MLSAGISTLTVHLGCQTVSTADAVTEGQRKFMGTLWNTYAFYVLYANIDEFDPTKYTLRVRQAYLLWINGYYQD